MRKFLNSTGIKNEKQDYWNNSSSNGCISISRETIEKYLGITAKKSMQPMQLGDVYKTFSNTDKLKEDYNYDSSTNIDQGIKFFIDWFKNYYEYKN